MSRELTKLQSFVAFPTTPIPKVLLLIILNAARHSCDIILGSKSSERYSIKLSNILRDRTFYAKKSLEKSDIYIKYFLNSFYPSSQTRLLILALNSHICTPSDYSHCLQFSTYFTKLPNEYLQPCSQPSSSSIKNTPSSSSFIPTYNNSQQTIKSRGFLLRPESSERIGSQSHRVDFSQQQNQYNKEQFLNKVQPRVYLKSASQKSERSKLLLDLETLWKLGQDYRFLAQKCTIKAVRLYDRLVSSQRETLLFDTRVISQSQIAEVLGELSIQLDNTEKAYLRLLKKYINCSNIQLCCLASNLCRGQVSEIEMKRLIQTYRSNLAQLRKQETTVKKIPMKTKENQVFYDDSGHLIYKSSRKLEAQPKAKYLTILQPKGFTQLSSLSRNKGHNTQITWTSQQPGRVNKLNQGQIFKKDNRMSLALEDLIEIGFTNQNFPYLRK